MTVLGIETSCDETSVAIFHHGVMRANVVSSQIGLHAEYGGVVPELAAREHLRNLLPLARRALTEAGLDVAALDAVAATRGPGLPNALMTGLKAGQALAFVLRRPFFGVHHHEAHLYSPWLMGVPLALDLAGFEPNLALIVSGGHTLLVQVRAGLRHRVLGGTLDDAAGECFDKTAKLAGLAYPGGPAMERLAEGGNPTAFAFPRPLLRDPGDDFSFSGLKTAVRYHLRDHPDLLASRAGTADLCASVQAAIVEVLVSKTVRAARRVGVACVTASGGVTCNRRLRDGLASACAEAGLRLRIAERSLCTDNAGMVAALASLQLAQGKPATALDAEIEPGWALDEEPAA